jgi:hypothetical protein
MTRAVRAAVVASVLTAALPWGGDGAGAAPPGAGRANADDRHDVQATVLAVSHHIDARRWAELRALYAAEVETDYVSLFGGKPQRQTADALIAGWQGALAGVATHHQLGPIDVRLDAGKRDRASARCHVRAVHQVAGAPGGELWEVLGHYVFELQRGPGGWRIDKMKVETMLQTGNRKLLAEAAAARKR